MSKFKKFINIIFKILLILLCIIPIYVFIYFTNLPESYSAVPKYEAINIVLLVIIELMNILITVLILKNKFKKKIFVIFAIIYFIIILFVPCYKCEEYAETEPGFVIWHDPVIVKNYKDIFGINLNWLTTY